MEVEKQMRPCEALILQLYCLCRFHNKFNIKLKKQSNEAALEAVNCIFNENKVKGYLLHTYYILCNAILILNYSSVLFSIAFSYWTLGIYIYIYIYIYNALNIKLKCLIPFLIQYYVSHLIITYYFKSHFHYVYSQWISQI